MYLKIVIPLNNPSFFTKCISNLIVFYFCYFNYSYIYPNDAVPCFLLLLRKPAKEFKK